MALQRFFCLISITCAWLWLFFGKITGVVAFCMILNSELIFKTSCQLKDVFLKHINTKWAQQYSSKFELIPFSLPITVLPFFCLYYHSKISNSKICLVPIFSEKSLFTCIKWCGHIALLICFWFFFLFSALQLIFELLMFVKIFFFFFKGNCREECLADGRHFQKWKRKRWSVRRGRRNYVRKCLYWYQILNQNHEVFSNCNINFFINLA